MGLALSCAGVVAEYHGRWFLRHRFNGEAARKERGMEVRAHLEEFDRLLNTLLPAIVQDAATSEGGRVYRAVMSRVEMPCCARPSSFRRAISSRPPGCSG